MVIGEQDIALKIFRARAGVMRQSRQAEIGAQSVKQRQWHRPFADIIFSIGNFVTDRGQVGRWKMPRHVLRPHHPDARAKRPVEHIGKRDFLARGMDRDDDIVFFKNQTQLRGQIIGKQRGPGYRRGVNSALGQAAKCAAGRNIVGIIGQIDPQFGVRIRSVIAPADGRDRAIGGKSGDIGAQCGDRTIVQAGQFGQGGGNRCIMVGHAKPLSPFGDSGKAELSAVPGLRATRHARPVRRARNAPDANRLRHSGRPGRQSGARRGCCFHRQC